MLRRTSGIAAHADAGAFTYSPLTNLFANI
jgi:hypothetical protein